jgi:hypothetical protein
MCNFESLDGLMKRYIEVPSQMSVRLRAEAGVLIMSDERGRIQGCPKKLAVGVVEI